ncbi:hypothetical protein RMATCC62417_15308 [Rhizopus microsporus]|nr:hypothetical protein RMATCC62417_15308 [Rhizopus microsporus]
MTVMKERNVYRYQPPSKHIISPHKSIIQAENLSAVKYYFDICINTCGSEASDETKAKHEAMVQEQSSLKSLKYLGPDMMNWVAKIVT